MGRIHEAIAEPTRFDEDLFCRRGEDLVSREHETEEVVQSILGYGRKQLDYAQDKDVIVEVDELARRYRQTRRVHHENPLSA